jgi:hypothetical protein
MSVIHTSQTKKLTSLVSVAWCFYFLLGQLLAIAPHTHSQQIQTQTSLLNFISAQTHESDSSHSSHIPINDQAHCSLCLFHGLLDHLSLPVCASFKFVQTSFFNLAQLSLSFIVNAFPIFLARAPPHILLHV